MKKSLNFTIGALAIGLIAALGTTPAYAASAIASSAEATVSAPAASNESRTSDPLIARTGDYEYVCVLTDGRLYSMAAGEPTTNCKGSYLQKYLDGRLLSTYHLAYGGGASTEFQWTSGCILATASGVLLIMSPGGTVVWYLSAAVTGASFLDSCFA